MTIGTLCWRETATSLMLLRDFGVSGWARRHMHRSSLETRLIVFVPEFAEVRQLAYTRRQLRYQGRAPEVDALPH